ncbi:MAG: hypothetical protein JJE39_00670 [Vicinamibacteria bacterium]|nr:hypothetical protein [Vicinamibacteria bacterium]
MALVLAAGLTVVSSSTVSTSEPSWICAYVAERLPSTLLLLGDDTVSGEETRAARARLSLSEAILTRASNLALARSLGATRLVVVRCADQGEIATIKAQAFDAVRPVAGALIEVSRPLADLATAIDEIARRLSPDAPPFEGLAFPAPSVKSLLVAGPALKLSAASERSRELTVALGVDPTSIGLRLSTVGALITARDFEAAIRLAHLPARPGTPAALVRALRFQASAAQLEAGRYAEARDTLETLRRARETAAVLNNLGVAGFRLREASASDLFERANSLLDHRQGDISFNRTLALLFEGKADRALARLDQALQNPTDARTRLLRVWALRLLNREPERAEEWERLLNLAPSFFRLGKPDLARRLERIFFSERTP